MNFKIVKRALEGQYIKDVFEKTSYVEEVYEHKNDIWIYYLVGDFKSGHKMPILLFLSPHPQARKLILAQEQMNEEVQFAIDLDTRLFGKISSCTKNHYNLK